MTKPKTPNQKRKYSELNDRLAKYVALIEEIYEQLNLEAAKLVSNSTDYNAEASKPFRWADYPQTRKKIADIQRQFVEDIRAVIMRGTSEEWKNSNEVQDLLANAVLRAYDAQVDGEQYRIYYQENSDALKAFQERKDKGMNVSSKLWSQAADYKQGLEDAISCAIEKGTSAVTLSKQISRYLQDFPSLQKDYKRRFGKATRAKDCEYRSIRLARSEINMAYRQAENQRWSQMDFVVGYEIKLSGSHHIDDICDQLKGKYPKTFIWTGWHPNDMCYKIPILKTEEEFWEWDGQSEVTTESVNEVKDVPDGFKQWVLDNQGRIDEAKKKGTLPYFLKDNKWAYSTKTLDVKYMPPRLMEVLKSCANNDNIEFLTDGKFSNFGDYIKSLGITENQAEKKISEVIGNSDIYMAIDFNVLTNKIIKGDGYFKSSIETGKGTFKTIGEQRAIKEHAIFGMKGDCSLDEYPKYGFLSSKGAMSYDNIVGWGYGDTFVRFKRDRVAPRSTFTIGDSYDGNRLIDKQKIQIQREYAKAKLDYAFTKEEVEKARSELAMYDKILSSDATFYEMCSPASPVNSPRVETLLHFSRRSKNKSLVDAMDNGIDAIASETGTYVECQIYGKLSIEDVASIEISSKSQKKKLEALIKKNKLNIDIVPSQFDTRLKVLEQSFTDYGDAQSRMCLSLTDNDIDNLGNFYIDGLCKRFADKKNGFWRSITMDDEFNNLFYKVSSGNATQPEKKAYIKLYLSEIRKRDKGNFPKEWWSDYRPSLGGWTDDVLNEGLLKR